MNRPVHSFHLIRNISSFDTGISSVLLQILYTILYCKNMQFLKISEVERIHVTPNNAMR